MFARLLSVFCLLFVLPLAPLLAQGAAAIAPGSGETPAIAPGAAAAKPLYANSYALLIGINDYQHIGKKLAYAVNDVTALREVLVKCYGFPAEHVTVLTDAQATKEGITNALADIANKQRVGKDDCVLIYFSGHGQTVPTPEGGAKGFLIPVDAEVDLNDLSDAAPYLKTCLSMDSIWDTLELCPAKHVLLIADACYSGLLANSRALDAQSDVSLQVLASRMARQVMTAGDQGQPVLEPRNMGTGCLPIIYWRNSKRAPRNRALCSPCRSSTTPSSAR